MTTRKMIWNGSAEDYHEWREQLETMYAEKNLIQCLDLDWQQPLRPIQAFERATENPPTASDTDYNNINHYTVHQEKRNNQYVQALSCIKTTVSESMKVMISYIEKSKHPSVAGQQQVAFTKKEIFDRVIEETQNKAAEGSAEAIASIMRKFEEIPKANNLEEMRVIEGLIVKLNQSLQSVAPERVKSDIEIIELFKRKLTSRLQTSRIYLQKTNISHMCTRRRQRRR
jgi:hypothetical protein